MCPVGEEKLTEEEVLAMRERLARHYGEPVRPVSEYCAAFRTWAEELQARQERRKGTDEEKYDGWVDALSVALSQVSKSSFLDRLIYVGEKKRTKMCPEHEGRWIGLQNDMHDICLHGCDKTGWLPEDDDPVREPGRRFLSAFREMPILAADEATRRAQVVISTIESGALVASEAVFTEQGLRLCGLSMRMVGDGAARKAVPVRHVGYRAHERVFEWVSAYLLVDDGE